MIYNWAALALLLADTAVLAVIVLQPLSRRYDDSDRGRGTMVNLPAFGRPSWPRAGFFLAVSAAVGTGLVLNRHPPVTQRYHQVMLHLLTWVIQDPSVVNAYADKLVPLVPAAFAGYLITVAIVMPGTVGRRIMILAHVPLLIAASLFTDCLLGLAVTALHLQPWSAPLISMYLQYFVGCVLVFRLFFTSDQLPNLTRVPRLRRGNLHDSLTLILCLISASCIVFAVTLGLYRVINVDAVISPIVLIPTQAAIIELMAVFLILIRSVGDKLPDPPVQRPPLDVIIPAYNESVCIERLLWSIDRAACRYGGAVRVIMCDDGSTDDTKALAEATMASFSYATGIVIHAAHSGKSNALNMALERCTADFVYRLDADCALDQDAFVYSMAQFQADPRVGLVGALQMPKEPYTTWIDRMRAFELFFMFGFLRVALAQVDAVPCIPGTFCAFRREAALAVGGFVTGMYSEDTDFTCAVTRLGYRAAIDTRVVSYEDVPTTVRQLRIQRFRWGIGSRLVFARFDPFNRDVGAPGPRFWFWMPTSSAGHLLGPAHIFLLLMSVEYSIIAPDARHNLAKWFVFLLVTRALTVVPKFLVLAYYRRLRLLPWALLWVPFKQLKRFFLLEALLAFRMRPVKPPLALRGRYPSWRSMLPPRRPPPGRMPVPDGAMIRVGADRP
jgi:cellulose synthase/poly-beta-1,6-N-acetylglucosamine synthase-like glycosyltransferase